ncbi:MAG: F0F1 ATP synthase subunit alpha [Clostridiales bacterium]|nr:F0F1 ATP synthase subunit alpha [Clostridiales bacterium]
MAQKTAETGRLCPVTLTYVTNPTEAQLAGIRAFAQRRCPQGEIDLTLKEDPSLGSGFLLTVGDEEFDWSTQGRLKQLREKLETAYVPNNDNLISILKTELEQFDLTAQYTEIGTVKTVGDGIATISGIDHAAYGEIILFDTGTKGMVQEIRREEIGAILFGNDLDIHEGSRVARTGKNAGVPVGRGFLGRVVNALGAPIDGGGDISADGYYPVESPAPGIVERQSVNRPLETGILAIDSMFPIGRGQRELIIGDRQTGKTSLALDTILNQKDKNVICIYVAIGQKSSTIARIVDILRRNDALSYSIVVAATASDSAPLQYIAPYAGTAMGEYFMHSGPGHVLMVYDDLSKHAVAYRTLSLLLERSPGREAYPGDVFYLHSRLLERSAQMSEANGGGSITALPIIETQAGDVSAYIPTNVISITDGQIFLESDLFFAGQRPAVNVGLSVSRVGGAAQTKAMKTATGSIRIDLAQYREMEIFTQFSSDLDDTTKRQLVYGEGLMELLKQPLSHPLTMTDQVITLVAALGQAFLPVPLKEIKQTQTKLLDWFRTQHGEIQRELERSQELSPTLRQQILNLVQEFFQDQAKPQA